MAWWELAILILGIVGGVVAGMSYARRQERQKRQTAQMWIYDPYDPQAASSAPSAHLGYSPGAFAPTTSASLAALAAQIAGAGDRDHLVRVASQWMVEALGLTSVVCYQHDPASMSLVTPVVAGLPIGHLPERVKFGATIFGDVARSRTHLLIENLYLDPRFPATTDAKLAYFLPLVHNGTLYGVLAALATRHQALGEPARLMIDKAVTLISATYSLTYRLGESGEVIARFERFQRMANRLSQHLEFETLFKEIVDAAVEMLDADVGILLNVNEAEQKLYPVAWAGIDTATAGLLRVRLKEDLKGLVAWARRPTRSANVLIDQRTSLASYAAIAGMTAEMVAPVLYQDQLVGILAVETRLSRFFTDDEMDLLLALASHAAIALHNARLFGDLQTSKVQLERAVADLEVARDQTEKAWIAAVEASKLKTEFINNMSHELRTPLNAVLNFTRIVLDGHAGQTNDQQKQFLGYVHDSGQHLLGLINDILDLAKIEAGRMDLRRDMTALEPILRGVMSTAVGLTRDRGLKLTLNLDPALPALEIDGQRIRQVLLNVVSNAAKFTLKGGITVSAVRREKDVLVSVQDTGIGIKPEDLDKVFEEFRQVDGTLTRTETGTGLGMPISRRFVELHNGSMWLESVHGTGTTVYFTLPLPAPANAMKIKTQEIETPPPDGD